MITKYDTFSANFSGRARKILKNAALAVKFGVNTADMLLLSIEIIRKTYFDILENFEVFQYFSTLQNQNQILIYCT